jgi:hypothetical protein
VGAKSIAIGDAAVAFSPLAGHGIRFALQSAFAAAAVVRTWREVPEQSEAALQYYEEFIRSNWRRHLGHLENLLGAASARRWRPIPETVRFVAAIRRTGIHRQSRIIMEEAVELRDGGLVRWIGGIDVLAIQTLTVRPVAPSYLALQLTRLGLTPEKSWQLVHWCIDWGILA